MKRDAHDECVACWYCEQPIIGRHEHDHVPPRRHGGTETVPACLNCHDLKDRRNLADWPADVVLTALSSIPAGPARVLFAKLHGLGLDAEQWAVTPRSEQMVTP